MPQSLHTVNPPSSLAFCCSLALSLLAILSPCVGAQETRFPGKWEWSALQASDIKNLEKSVKTGSSGFWELSRPAIQTRSDVSGRLTAEASFHAAHVIKTFPKTFKLPPSPSRAKSIKVAITIHKSENTFQADTAGADSELGFGKISPQDDGSSLAEIHLLSRWELHPGFENNLVECIDTGLLQGHLVRLLLQLWRPDQPLPAFLAKAYESYAETYDFHKGQSREKGIHRPDFRSALDRAILADLSLRPSLSEMLHLTQAGFDSNLDLNGAFSACFAQFMMTSAENQTKVHQLRKQAPPLPHACSWRCL